MSEMLDRARNSGTPLIDGSEVTFVWHGRRAPQLVADFTDWEQSPRQLTQAGENVWVHHEQLPGEVYIEYAYLDLESGQRVPDRFNPRSIPNGQGEDNHFFYMPEALPSPLTRRARGITKGKIIRHQVPTDQMAVGKERRVYLYQPGAKGPYPLLVVLDGNDYLGRGKLPQILDNLIAQGRIEPLALAMVAQSAQAREVEYLCSEATIGFIYERVLPLANRKLNLIDHDKHPGGHGIMGASLGGLMAMYAGLRLPEIFGRVLSQSGVFRFDDHDSVVMELVRHLPPQPLKVWMDVGKFEYLLSENQRLRDLLVRRGYQIKYREYLGGHNYTSWRNDLWRGLEFLFPPD
jgi:enterochelin esterase family protein